MPVFKGWPDNPTPTPSPTQVSEASCSSLSNDVETPSLLVEGCCSVSGAFHTSLRLHSHLIQRLLGHLQVLTRDSWTCACPSQFPKGLSLCSATVDHSLAAEGLLAFVLIPA